MELWERSASLAALDGLLRDSARGGRIALVSGEAGIGKSVLVAEFARRAGPRARFLWGSCDRLVTPRALGPLHDIGRQAGGGLADALRSGAGAEDVLAALLDTLAPAGLSQLSPRHPAHRRPTPVVVVEDAHWADGATLDLLVLLGRRIGRRPALLVVTYRDDEVGPDHPLHGTLAALPRAAVGRVPVPPLSEDCVATQATRAGRDAAAVRALAGGNPLLVTELLEAGADVVPASARDLILDRLHGLPLSARKLARLVAVVPTRADPPVLAGAAADVERCLDAGVLVAAGDAVAYRHEILRAAVENALPPSTRRTLHREVLAALSTVDGIDPARLVHHARRAGDPEAVLRFGIVAGRAAAAQGAHREAAAHFHAAAGYADRLGPAERAELFEDHAVESYLSGRSDVGLLARKAALTLREELGQPDRVGENLRWISRLAWWTGRAREANDAGARAVDILETLPPDRALAMAYSNRSQLSMLASDTGSAVEWGEKARALADALGDTTTSVHAAINVASARLNAGDLDQAAALTDAHARAAALGLVDDAARALVNLGTTLVQLGRYGAAEPVVDRALAYTTDNNVDGYTQYLHGVRADIRRERGDWDGALADADTSLAMAARSGVAVVPALVARGRVAAARGDPAALSTLDDAAREAARTGELQRIGPVAAARSELYLLLDDPARAAAAAREAIPLAAKHPWHLGELAHRLWRADPDAALPDGLAPPFRSMVQGDWSGAAAAFERLGASYLRLEALAGGDRDAAIAALAAFDRLGATRRAARLRADLRRLGVAGVPRGPRPATAVNPAGLTPRQADVLDLLAEGLSNAEIARRLTVSAKTVEHHISAVLAKLGVASRGQAAAAARRLDLGASPHSPDGAGL